MNVCCEEAQDALPSAEWGPLTIALDAVCCVGAFDVYLSTSRLQLDLLGERHL
jgi:hypothetical protein